jgi:ATP-binding cassette subfamily B protein/subfamily B ATP-binding cassette protein MsbA
MIARPARPYRWVLAYLLPHWKPLTTGAFVMSARAVVLLLLPWPLKYTIDNVIFGKPLPGWLHAMLPDLVQQRMALLNLLALAMIGLGAMDALLVYLGNRLFLDTGQRVVFAIRFDLFAHLQRLSLEFHRRHRGGEIMSRLNDDVKQLQDFVAAVGIDILPHVLTILGMACVMFVMDLRYALIALSIAPVLFFIARSYSQRLRQALRQVRNHEGTLAGVTQEILANVQVVQAFARESHERDRFGSYASQSLLASLHANHVQSRYGPTMNLVIALGTGAIIWYGAASVIRGLLTPGDLLVFLAYLRGIATPARQLSKAGRVIGRASVALERIGDYLAEPPSVVDPVGAVAPSERPQRLEFAGVHFGYRPEGTVLHDVSFTLEAGKTVALVGPTGAGKSTIASLIPRFYDPTAGAVLLDGRDVRRLPLAYLRRQVGVVQQETVLFQATIWENIAYGREGAQRSEAVQAAREVGVDRMIEQLPGGFDALVSERGLSLSGGQRQCIAIARAMLGDTPVVVLDEPSSSLDPRTERDLMFALSRLASRRSALIIAHRLSTVMNADLILVLEQGRIVQRGTHSDLLASGGLYATLWQALRDDVPAAKLRVVAL